jgi:hypothetical protein
LTAVEDSVQALWNKPGSPFFRYTIHSLRQNKPERINFFQLCGPVGLHKSMVASLNRKKFAGGLDIRAILQWWRP